jgi:predicted RecA/RadA family phage recombinase
MKTKLLMVAILVALTTYGSSCVYEGFLIPVNVPIVQTYAINPGTQLSFGDDTTIVLKDQIDGSWVDKIKGGRFYDLRVSVHGTYNGTVVGLGYVNGIHLLNYGSGPNATSPAPWSAFTTPQSLLGKSPYIKLDTLGINELVRVMNQFANDPDTKVRVASNGTLAGQSPVPAGLSITFEILTQADAELNK